MKKRKDPVKKQQAAMPPLQPVLKKNFWQYGKKEYRKYHKKKRPLRGRLAT